MEATGATEDTARRCLAASGGPGVRTGAASMPSRPASRWPRSGRPSPQRRAKEPRVGRAGAEAVLAQGPRGLEIDHGEVRGGSRAICGGSSRRSGPAPRSCARARSRAARRRARRAACRGRRTRSPGPVTPKAPPRTAPPSRRLRAARGRSRSPPIVPSRSASIERVPVGLGPSGGFIFRFGSRLPIASSVRQRWCGVTSPVAATPRPGLADLLHRLAAETWRTWSGCSSYAASARSRPTMTLSATDGIAGEAELDGDGALVHLAASGERRLLAVDGDAAGADLVVLERPPQQAGRAPDDRRR